MQAEILANGIRLCYLGVALRGPSITALRDFATMSTVQTASIPSTRCQVHPTRSGIAVCMGCSIVLCEACSTRIDGINHCKACLTARAVSSASISHNEEDLPPTARWLAVGVLCAGIALSSYAVLYLLWVW